MTLWLSGVKHLSSNFLFYGSVGSDPGRAQKYECNFFFTDFFHILFFEFGYSYPRVCSQTMWTEKGEGKAFLPYVWNDLVHSVLATIQKR